MATALEVQVLWGQFIIGTDNVAYIPVKGLFMKNHILLFLVSTLIFGQNNSYAMDKEIREGPRTPQVHLIIPPEHMEAMNRMQLLAVRHPHIAQERPLIRSTEEFKIAKEYLGFKKQYYALVFAGAMYGPPGNDGKTRLLQDSERVLKSLQSYVEVLQGPSSQAFRSPQDDKSLEHEMYDIFYNTAQSHLMQLIAQILSPNLRNDSLTINDRIKEIKKIREQVSENREFRNKLQKIIQDAQENVPALRPLFNPQMQANPPQPPKQKSRRIEGQRTVNHYQKISNGIPKDCFQDLESFDYYFQTVSMDIFTNHLSLSVKKMPLEDYATCFQDLTEKCLSLEKKGMEFKTFLSRQAQPIQPNILSSKELTDLYKFFCQRYELPHKSPLQLLESSILIFIQANKIEEALNRIEALKTFLLERGPLPDYFRTLRASIMALNGNSEEWRTILEEKKTKTQNAKAIAEQKHVNHIKQQQEKAKQKQEEAEKLKNALVTAKEKERQERQTKTNHGSTETGFIEEDPKDEPPLLPRIKIKTRKAFLESEDHDTPQKDTKDENQQSQAQPPKDYPVSKNAFKTYGKVRRGDWKFSRNDLSNLFRDLKCRVDFSQGKGCHSMIHPPLDMMIINGDELVAVIPEFISTELPFPITAPDWDAKWSGIVPYYMRKGIVRALDYLGATDETVHK